MKNRSLWWVLALLLALLLAACDALRFFEPTDANEALTQAAVIAALETLEAEEALTRAPSPTPTETPAPSATASLTPAPTATATDTPTPSPTPDLTATALAANCTGDVEALKACLNETVLSYIMPDVEPEHRVVDNADPATLYRRPEVLDILGQDGTVLRHNLYNRGASCPLTTACVLHVLLISLVSPEAAQQFFDLVTEDGAGLPNESLLDVPNAEAWDASKCAEGTRPTSQAGGPDFNVVYCSVSKDNLHYGFNLSSYEMRPEDLSDTQLQLLLVQLYTIITLFLSL